MAKGSENIQQEAGYSMLIGFVYVFNLIIGAGVLALPKAFSQTGCILGLIALGILGLISYCSTTFMVEAMAITNALLRLQSREKKKSSKKGEFELSTTGHDLIIENASEPVLFINSHADDMVVNSNHSKENQLESKEGGTEDSDNKCEDVPIGGKETKYKDSDQETTKTKDANGAVHEGPVTNGVLANGSFKKSADIPDSESQLDLDSLYEINVKVEIGEMTRMLFHKAGVILYYISISLYLFGGLSIYATAVSKSLTTVICGDSHSFNNGSVDKPCQNVPKFSIILMYRIVLAGFVATICPFVFFTVSKTKFLQIFTTIYRWSAISSMIILAAVRIGKGNLNTETPMFEFSSLPNFFGVAVYAFMCQHSIPAVLTPVDNKRRMKITVFVDFICVFIFYALLLLTAVFSFEETELSDLYSLNFAHPLFFRYFLMLFPVFTLSANFPVLAIVLRENLKTLFLKNGGKDNGIFLRRILFPLIVIAPPICVAASTTDVGALVGYTGTYAGAIIQYVIPTMLVYCGRKRMINLVGEYNNKYRSPFHHIIWVYLVMIWYLVCLVFVTYNKISTA